MKNSTVKVIFKLSTTFLVIISAVNQRSNENKKLFLINVWGFPAVT